jgi:hypothetical protein
VEVSDGGKHHPNPRVALMVQLLNTIKLLFIYFKTKHISSTHFTRFLQRIMYFYLDDLPYCS